MKLYHRSFLLALLASRCLSNYPFSRPRRSGGELAERVRASTAFTFNVHRNSDLSAFPNLISGTLSQLADTAHGGYVNQNRRLNGRQFRQT